MCLAALAGCGPASFWREHFRDTLAGEKAVTRKLSSPRELAMFDGHDGAVVAWDDLLEAVRLADVVAVGEPHTDAVAHQVELAIAEDALLRWPGSAVSMEMLERDDQPATDDYLAAKISQDEFIKRTGSADWAGKDTWKKWFQPIVDAARAAKGRVVAANAPRKYAEMARKQGYGALRALPEAERKLFDVPERATYGAYYRTFRRQMQEHPAPAKPAEQKPAAPKPEDKAPAEKKPEEKPKAPEPPAQPAEQKKPAEPKRPDVPAMFRAQQVWDATMAASILKAAEGGKRKVIHLVGAFHTDFDGGLVRRIRRGNADLTVLTISLVPAHSRRLRRDDRGRADVVIYTCAQ